MWPCLRRHLTPEEQDRFDAINTQSIFENVDQAFYAAALRKQGSVGIALGTSVVIALLSDAVAVDYYAQEPASFFGDYVAWLAKGPGTNVKPLELAGWTNTWIAEDREFKKAATLVRRGQFYFVLAHELGHIVHGHNLAGLSSEERVMIENEADDFAIRMIEAEVADPAPRSEAGVPASGAHVWLLAHSMMANPISNEENATHTPSLLRMQRVANQLSKSPQLSTSESTTFSRLSANLAEIAQDPSEAERQRQSAIAAVTKDHLRRFVPARPPAASIAP